MRQIISLFSLLIMLSVCLQAQTLRTITQIKQTNLDSLARYYNGSPLAPPFSSNVNGDTVTVIAQVIWSANQSFDATNSRALMYIIDTARTDGNKPLFSSAVTISDNVGNAGSRDSSLFNVPRGEVIKLTAVVRNGFGSPAGYQATIELDKINFTSLDLDEPLAEPLPLPDTLEIPLDSLFKPDGNMDMLAEKYDGMIVRITGPMNAVVPSQVYGSNGRFTEFYVTKPLATSLTGVLGLPIGDNSRFFRSNTGGGGGVANPEPLPPNGAIVNSITGVLSKVRSNNTSLLVDNWLPFGNPVRTWRLHPFNSADIVLAAALPPVFASTVRNFVVAPPASPVTVSSTISMPNAGDTVTSAQVFYNTTSTLPDRTFGGPYTAVNAVRSSLNDSVWTADIPGQPEGTYVNYFVKATGSNGLTVLDRDTLVAKNFYRVGTSPRILDIQFSPYDNPSNSDVVSPLVNSTITVRGVVTADSLSFLNENNNAPIALHIQDGQTPWSGIRVVVNGYTTSGGQVVIGDSVEVTGIVRESFNYTQIDARQSANGSVTKLGTASSVISPLQLNTDTLGVLSEKFEGMLVQVNDVEVVRTRLTGQEFTVRQQGSQSKIDYAVDDLSGWAYRGGGVSASINPNADTVLVGSRFGFLRGIHFFSFGSYKITPPRTGGFGNFVLSSGTLINTTPTSFALEQNYPNPFNPLTMIRYNIASRADVSLKVYDILGREVATLVNASQGQGAYQVPFNASNLSSGVYFYRLQAGTFVQTKKMILVK